MQLNLAPNILIIQNKHFPISEMDQNGILGMQQVAGESATVTVSSAGSPMLTPPQE
jgi:hypothetical protein